MKSLNYRPDIDGLRAVAALSVPLYHAGVARQKDLREVFERLQAESVPRVVDLALDRGAGAGLADNAHAPGRLA